MPRYFFDVREADEVAVDLEGQELPDYEAAQREAAVAAACLTTELFKGATFAFGVEVRSEDGQIVARVTVSLDIEST